MNDEENDEAEPHSEVEQAASDVWDATRLGREYAEIREAIGALKAGLAAEATYANSKIVEVLLEHPLYIKLKARQAEISAELVGRV